jgi:hypothetical protein
MYKMVVFIQKNKKLGFFIKHEINYLLSIKPLPLFLITFR